MLVVVAVYLVTVISSCVGIAIGSWMMSVPMASSRAYPSHTRRICPFVEVTILVDTFLVSYSVVKRCVGAIE